MSKSGDPSPSSPKKTSANKKASESKEKIAARPAAKNSKTAPKAAPVKKNSAKAAAPAAEKASAKPVAEKKAPAKKAETKPTGPDMEELKNAFVKNYSRLYQTDDDHESGEFYDAVDKFDEMSANDSQFAATVQKFNKYMGDLISSDREAAAFVMALDNLEKAKTPEMVPTVQQLCFA